MPFVTASRYFITRADIVGKTHYGVSGTFFSCILDSFIKKNKNKSGALFAVANQSSINIVSSRQGWM